MPNNQPNTKPDERTPLQSAWNRLQCLSCLHSLQLWRADKLNRKWHTRGHIGVPEVIRENVEILGRGDEAEIKTRVLWYVTYYPAIFNECSAKGWTL